MSDTSEPPRRGQRITRRRLLTAGVVIPIASAAGAAAIEREMPWREGAADLPSTPRDASSKNYAFFSAAEAAFVEAAVARLIPADELGPGAVEAGVPGFIDRQLAGDYGVGARWYMQGPWGEGEKTQGWQTRFTPAGLYRAAIREIDEAVGKEGRATTFARLAAGDQERWLQRLQAGEVQLASADAQTFFQLLHQNTLEGFFADPIHGGNRDMVGWKLIGFPGARYDHSPYVKKHGEKYPLPPVSISGRPDWNTGGSNG